MQEEVINKKKALNNCERRCNAFVWIVLIAFAWAFCVRIEIFKRVSKSEYNQDSKGDTAEYRKTTRYPWFHYGRTADAGARGNVKRMKSIWSILDNRIFVETKNQVNQREILSTAKKLPETK